MDCRTACGKINVKLAIILVLFTASVAFALVAVRQVRRTILAERDLKEGTAAYEEQDWAASVKYFAEYLGRRPNDIEVWRKYARARLAVRPFDMRNVGGAISAYRRVMQLDASDETAYEKLVSLYSSMGNSEDLAYMARQRLERDPNHTEAPLSLAIALARMHKTDEARQVLLKLISRLETLDKCPVEYAKACIQMSQLVLAEGVSEEAKAEAIQWLDRAVAKVPDSVEALTHRAGFYRVTRNIPGKTDAARVSLARADLEAADAIGTRHPGIRYYLGSEWLEHGEPNRAAAELQAIDNLTPEEIEEHFLDSNDWTVAKFLLTAQLTLRRQAVEEGVSLADETLATLTEQRHRARALPPAVRLYLAGGRIPQARKYLDEFLVIASGQEKGAVSETELALLQAFVARAEDQPYVVIDTLQPVVVRDSSDPRLWRLLSEAFSRTDQPRRAVNAMIQYLRFYPQDADMQVQLAREYLKLQDWDKTLETARAAESLNRTDVVLRLLRIEAGIHQEVGQNGKIGPEKLQEFSAELTQLRQDDPNRVDVRLLQAALANYQEQPEKAESELRLAIEECDEPLRAELELVRHLYKMKRPADALAACQALCTRHPTVAEPWLSLSSLYVASADYASARDCLKKGLKTVVDAREKRSLTMALALLEVANGDRTTGIRLLSDLAAENEHEIRVRSLLLGIREIQEDKAKATRLIDELRKAEGDSGLLWRLHQASLWLSSADWKSRQQDIEDMMQYCITADPEWSSPALILAELYGRLDNPARVEDICRQTLVRNPSATDIADKLLTLLEKQGRSSEVEKVLQQVEATPQAASAWRVKSAIRTGDFSEAIEELKLRASNDERDADSRVRLARLIYGQAKDAEQALRYLDEVEAISPGSLVATGVRASILRAEGRTEDLRRTLDGYVADHNDFNAYLLRASFLNREGDLQNAEADYKKLLSFAEKGTTGYELLSAFYVTNDRIDQAVAAVEDGLLVYPQNAGLQRRLMTLLFSRGRLADRQQDRQRAMEILATLEQRSPDDPELMKIRARTMLETPTPQSVEAARVKLEAVVKAEPTAIDAHLLLIQIAMQTGKYRAARDYAIQALGSNSNEVSLLSARAKAELALGNAPMATEVSRQTLQKDPNSVDALDVFVQAAVARNDPRLLDEARVVVESTFTRGPRNERPLILRSRFLTLLKQPEKAIPELETYCQSQEGSQSVAAIVTLADLYRLTGDMEQSGKKIERAAQLAPNSQTVVHGRFLWLVAQKRYDELGQIASAYVSAEDQDSSMVHNAATLLLSQESAELKREAVKLFQHGISRWPASVELRRGLASGLYQVGDFDAAAKAYRALVDQYPEDVQSLNDLAWVLQERSERYDEALELANRGLRIAPTDMHLLDTKGTILSKMPGRLPEAKGIFEQIVGLSSTDPRRLAVTHLQLGRVCMQLDDSVQAKLHLENVQEIDRTHNVLTTQERSETARLIERLHSPAAP